MKKIIMTVAVVFTAAFVNAAAVDWSASAVCDPVATAAAGKNTPANGWIGYMIMAADYTTVTEALASGSTSELIAAAVGPIKHTSNKGAFAYDTASGNIAAGSQDFYMIVLNAATADAATSYFASQKVTVTVDESLPTLVAFQSQANNSKLAANWTSMSVPEPTSGLLLLLGMAGLALKRKRA